MLFKKNLPQTHKYHQISTAAAYPTRQTFTRKYKNDYNGRRMETNQPPAGRINSELFMPAIWIWADAPHKRLLFSACNHGGRSKKPTNCNPRRYKLICARPGRNRSIWDFLDSKCRCVAQLLIRGDGSAAARQFSI